MTSHSSSPTLPREAWTIIVRFALEGLPNLSACNRELRILCRKECENRLIPKYRFILINGVQYSKILPNSSVEIYFSKNILPVPVISVNSFGYQASLIFLKDGPMRALFRDFNKINGEKNRLYAVVSDRIEMTLEPTDSLRCQHYRKCGIFAYEAPNENLKRIELRWQGIFCGKRRLFGIPLIIFVPRIVDRNFVHQEVFRRVSSFLKKQDHVCPPYILNAYVLSVYEEMIPVPFTNDYMVIDSQMHPTGTNFILIIDFGSKARELVNFEMFADNSNLETMPCKTSKLISNLLERDCGIRAM